MSGNLHIVAYQTHKEGAAEAFALFKQYAPHSRHVPGMSTDIRLAWRIECGRSIEEAAAREYVYRWSLALGGHAWAANEFAPHSLGM